MSDGLRNAKALASTLRYSEDTPWNRSVEADSRVEAVREYFSQNALRITHEVTPALHARLAAVYGRLDIPPEAIDAYVQSSADIQAESFTGHTTECVIRFSSALVDILDQEEFNFVAGHEIAHFLLNHGSSVHNANSLEHFMRQRSQEISADRLGLLAGGSLDVAVKALMKTVSGLTSNHLRFDVRTFIAQLRKPVNGSVVNNRSATHPSVFVRCKALLWFSMTKGYLATPNEWDPKELSTLNARVKADFEAYVDGPIRKQIQAAKNDYAMWSTAVDMVSDGVFTKTEQTAFGLMFGSATLEKFRNFLKELARGDVQEAVTQRMNHARRELAELIPETVDSEVERISISVRSSKYRAEG